MAISFQRIVIPAALLALGTPLSAQPSAEQAFAELDALAEQTATEEQGIAAARQQTEQGRLLEALATLERVLTQFPESAAARFDHAMLLCWIDDPQGALVEFERLDEDDYEPGVLEQARENCGTVTQEREQ